MDFQDPALQLHVPPADVDKVSKPGMIRFSISSHLLWFCCGKYLHKYESNIFHEMDVKMISIAWLWNLTVFLSLLLCLDISPGR